MHTLQPKHIKLKNEEVKKLTDEYNISVSQLPKIKSTDSGLPQGCERGDVVKIERETDGKKREYFRTVI